MATPRWTGLILVALACTAWPCGSAAQVARLQWKFADERSWQEPILCQTPHALRDAIIALACTVPAMRFQLQIEVLGRFDDQLTIREWTWACSNLADVSWTAGSEAWAFHAKELSKYRKAMLSLKSDYGNWQWLPRGAERPAAAAAALVAAAAEGGPSGPASGLPCNVTRPPGQGFLASLSSMQPLQRLPPPPPAPLPLDIWQLGALQLRFEPARAERHLPLQGPTDLRLEEASQGLPRHGEAGALTPSKPPSAFKPFRRE